MITDVELASMQATQAGALAEPCIIYRRSYALDGAGGTIETEAGIASICRLSASNSQPDQSLVAGAQREGIAWRVTLPASADIHIKDRIAIGSRSFEVLAVYGPATWGTAKQCVCIES